MKETEETLQREEWTLMAGGDFYVGSPYLKEQVSKGKSLFDAELRSAFEQADLAVLNLEAPITHREAHPISKQGANLRMEPAALDLLPGAEAGAVSLANNHMMDFGRTGLADTLDACQSQGIIAVGAGLSFSAATAISTLHPRSGLSVGLLAVCEHEFGIAEAGRAGTAPISDAMLEERVAQAAQKHDVVVVCAHGGVEYVPFSPVRRREQLLRIAEAGADVVIGHHPHVPQGWEWTDQGSLVMHSLGNFCFLLDSQTKRPATAWGLLARIRFRGDNPVGIDPLPTYWNGKRICRADERREQTARAYLKALNRVLEDDRLFRGCWQEIALRLWRERYQPALRKIAWRSQRGATVVERGLRRLLGRTASTPVQHFGAVHWLNHIRTESHRWTQETALAVQVGDQPDVRTPEAKSTVTDLLRRQSRGLR